MKYFVIYRHTPTPPDKDFTETPGRPFAVGDDRYQGATMKTFDNEFDAIKHAISLGLSHARVAYMPDILESPELGHYLETE